MICYDIMTKRQLRRHTYNNVTCQRSLTFLLLSSTVTHVVQYFQSKTKQVDDPKHEALKR